MCPGKFNVANTFNILHVVINSNNFKLDKFTHIAMALTQLPIMLLSDHCFNSYSNLLKLLPIISNVKGVMYSDMWTSCLALALTTS